MTKKQKFIEENSVKFLIEIIKKIPLYSEPLTAEDSTFKRLARGAKKYAECLYETLEENKND